MKQIASILILVSFLLLPLVTSAVAAPTTCTLRANMIEIDAACTKGAVVNIDTHGACCLVNTLYVITDWIFMILMVVVGLMIIMGAFSIITAGGNPEKVNQGRKYIMYAIIGMMVAWFAKAVPNITKMMIGT